MTYNTVASVDGLPQTPCSVLGTGWWPQFSLGLLTALGIWQWGNSYSLRLCLRNRKLAVVWCDDMSLYYFYNFVRTSGSDCNTFVLRTFSTVGLRALNTGCWLLNTLFFCTQYKTIDICFLFHLTLKWHETNIQ